MALDAHEKLKKSLYEESFMLYEKALAFPVEKLEYNIYYNMAEACLGIDDEKKAKKYLVASIRDKGDFVPSLEKLGYLYYRDRDFIRAREMLGRAAAAGSKNEQVIRALNALR